MDKKEIGEIKICMLKMCFAECRLEFKVKTQMVEFDVGRKVQWRITAVYYSDMSQGWDQIFIFVLKTKTFLDSS